MFTWQFQLHYTCTQLNKDDLGMEVSIALHITYQWEFSFFSEHHHVEVAITALKSKPDSTLSMLYTCNFKTIFSHPKKDSPL